MDDVVIRMYFRYDSFKKQVCTLLLTLNSESLGGCTEILGHTSRHALLRFRKVALAVIAARRLRLLPQMAKRVFTFTDYDNSQAVVCLGSLKSAKKSGELFVTAIHLIQHMYKLYLDTYAHPNA